MPEPSRPVRPEESLARMIASLKEKTGRSLEEWKEVISHTGWAAHGEIVKGLKAEHGVSHAYANQIALRFREGNSPSSHPIDEMFTKRPEVRGIYDQLVARMGEFGSDVDWAPKKGYVSVRRSKQFAILQPASGRLDVGIQLKGTDSTDRLEASGSFNSMLSHRVRVGSFEEVDAELMGWLKQAYEAA